MFAIDFFQLLSFVIPPTYLSSQAFVLWNRASTWWLGDFASLFRIIVVIETSDTWLGIIFYIVLAVAIFMVLNTGADSF